MRQQNMKTLLKIRVRKEMIKKDLQLRNSDKTLVGTYSTFIKYVRYLTLCVTLLLKKISPA